MEKLMVEIKKVRLTKSIFNQVGTVSGENLDPDHVIGWVRITKSKKRRFYDNKYVLFHNPDTKELSKLMIWSGRKYIGKDYRDKFCIKLTEAGYVAKSFCFETEVESIQFLEKMNQAIYVALERGQMYL